MDATTTPPDATPPGRRARASASAPPARKGRRRLLIWGGVGLVVLGAGVWFGMSSLSDTNVHHTLKLEIPASAPTGEPLHVDYALQAGDVFVTTLISKSGILLKADAEMDPKEGMNFDAKFTVGHAVQAAPPPATGLSSLVRLYVERADAKYQDMSAAVWLLLGNRDAPYEVVFRRDAANRPDRASLPSADAQRRARRQMLDLVLGGLGDLSSNFLPPRDVRAGEVWDLDDVGDFKDGIENVIRGTAQRQPGRQGFPPVTIVGKVRAAGFESRPPVALTYDDLPPPPPGAKPPAGTPPPPAAPAGPAEPCVRLDLFVTVAMEGETHEPKMGPGWISAAARISGPIWVSRATGILWAVDLTGDVVSTYRTGLRPTEIKAQMRIKSTTERAKKMPV
jgi:hypothetical protein